MDFRDLPFPTALVLIIAALPWIYYHDYNCIWLKWEELSGNLEENPNGFSFVETDDSQDAFRHSLRHKSPLCLLPLRIEILLACPALYSMMEGPDAIVDFVYRYQRKIYAVEVKSGRRKSAKGLDAFVKRFPAAHHAGAIRERVGK
jgi:hypothetical protein